MSIRVFTDFDGTVTRTDSLVFLLDAYVGSSWLEIERRVEDGSLPEWEGLRQEVSLLTVPYEQARRRLLEELPLDPGFAAFAAFCEEKGWPLSILSGGLRPLIDALLERDGLSHLPVHSNDLAFEEDGRWRVVSAPTPRIRELCNHCKTWWLREAAGPVIYIGDGTTDRCPGREADLLFAKGGLARWSEEQGVPHLKWERFVDILDWMESPAGRSRLEALGASSGA